MLDEFQEIYDLWKLQEKKYDRFSVDTVFLQRDIKEAENIDELITILDSTRYSKSYNVDFKEIFAQIVKDYPETQERTDAILFKREIAKIISPNYRGDNDDVDKIKKLDNVDEIIDVLSKIGSKNKTKALAYIKEQLPDKAEKIDAVLPKLLVLQNVYDDWNEREKINSLKEAINQAQNLDEIISHITDEGMYIESFDVFETLQSIQNAYPEKTATIQEIVNNFTKAETYKNLSSFYSNVFKMMQVNPERSQEYIELIKEQLASDKNNAESLDVIYKTLGKIRYDSVSGNSPIANRLYEHPNEAVPFAELYVKALNSEKNTPDTFRDASKLLYKVIEDVPDRSMELIKKFYAEDAEKQIGMSIKQVLRNNHKAAQEYLGFVKADLDLGDEGSGRDYSSYLIDVIKSQPDLVTSAEELYKQHLEAEIKSLDNLRAYHRTPDVEINTEQRIVNMLEKLGKLYDYKEQSKFALNLIEKTLKTVDFHEPELTGNEEDDYYILQRRKDRASDREIEKQIYEPLNSFLNDKESAERCLDVVEAGLKNNVKADFQDVAHLLQFINMVGAPEISDRVSDNLNKLWSMADKEVSFKTDMQEEVLETLQEMAEKSPEKARKNMPILLDMYELSKQAKKTGDDIKPTRTRKIRRETSEKDNAYNIANRLEIISVMTDIAPEMFAQMLPDLEKAANFDAKDAYQCEENLSKIVAIIQKGIKKNPDITEKVLPIVSAVVANRYHKDDANKLLSDMVQSTLISSPEKLEKCWQIMQTAGNFRSLHRVIKHSSDENFLKTVLHKKEEAYANETMEFKYIRIAEKAFAKRKYIKKTLNMQYPGIPLAEQLIQAAYDVVSSGDEQKKKEFNDFILAEGESRLAQLDAKVMDYLYENCTQNNLDKVNALRSFYGLKVELKAGNAVDIDERTAVRKIFDRTWSSYERGKNAVTGEPYYSDAELEKARKEDPDQVKTNPYYENAVSPAYRKYFEENDIYEIYKNGKHSEEEKQYSAQDYFDSLIDKSPFKALRKHGLYNDMKIICETLEALQVEPEISSQFNLKDLSDMVVNSHNTLEDRKVYTRDYEEEYMFTKSPHTDELDGNWRDPYYWHQYDDDDDEYYDEDDNEDYDENDDNNESEISVDEKQYDEDGFEIIPETDNYSERNEEVAARDAWWEDLSEHNPKAVKHISEAFARHGREDEAISGFMEAAGYGTPGVGSRRDFRLLSATLHHAEAIQYGGSDDKNNFVGVPRYYDKYGNTFDKDRLYLDPHKSFHRRDTPMDALYMNLDARSADDKLAITKKTSDNSQKAFLITSFTDQHMHFYAGFRKIDQYTAPLYHMRNIEKENQERVVKVEAALDYLTKLGNALVSISVCMEEAVKTEEKINTAKDKITRKITNTEHSSAGRKNDQNLSVKINANGKNYE